jgi:hypothetical protein
MKNPPRRFGEGFSSLHPLPRGFPDTTEFMCKIQVVGIRWWARTLCNDNRWRRAKFPFEPPLLERPSLLSLPSETGFRQLGFGRTPSTNLMLSMEEFSCQCSMERTCGHYCSSQMKGETTAWGQWNYLRLDLDDIGSFDSPPQLRRGGPQRH